MSEHTGSFYWSHSIGTKHPGHGSILGDEDDPATGQPFIMAVMKPPTEIDPEIDLTEEHEGTPVIYTQQKLPGIPAYFAKTVTKKK